MKRAWVVAITLLFLPQAHSVAMIVALTPPQQATLTSAANGRSQYVAPPSSGPLSVLIAVPDVLKNANPKRPTLAWTQVATDAFIKHKTSPNRAARALASLHVAMHDAWFFVDERCGAASPAACAPDARVLAANAAAARVLRYIFVSEENNFDRYVHQLAFAGAVGSDAAASRIAEQKKWLSVGQLIGEIAVKHAETDGAAKGWNGSSLEYYGEGRVYGPGSWEPTAPYFYYPPEEPFAPNWRPWALSKPSEFRPTPPAFASERYLKDLREVIVVSRDQLTDDKKKVALFWADGRGSVTPAGHWNQIALALVKDSDLTDSEIVRLFARLNMALADAFIAAWDAKYAYWTLRPVTAAKKLLGIDWSPMILTPPFPSYVSGHAAFSGAASVVLSAYLPQQKALLDAMAEEAAMSRLFGGIHFRFDNEDGLALGRRVGAKVLALSVGKE
jgi:PAP2 superfamily